MDLTVYRFILPVCMVAVSLATFSGINSGALMTPTSLVGLPAFGTPLLTTMAAIDHPGAMARTA